MRGKAQTCQSPRWTGSSRVLDVTPEAEGGSYARRSQDLLLEGKSHSAARRVAWRRHSGELRAAPGREVKVLAKVGTGPGDPELLKVEPQGGARTLEALGVSWSGCCSMVLTRRGERHIWSTREAPSREQEQKRVQAVGREGRSVSQEDTGARNGSPSVLGVWVADGATTR